MSRRICIEDSSRDDSNAQNILFFRALADRTRLRILNLMRSDEVCVCFFIEVLKTHQPKVRRHLAYLRKAGIVGARREGPLMHYRIVEPADSEAARVLRDTLAWLGNDPEMSAIVSD